MTDPVALPAPAPLGYQQYPPDPVAPTDPVAPLDLRRDLRAALLIVVAMAAAGLLLGLIWAWWSPGSRPGYLLARNVVVPDDSEAFIGGDGRFAVLTVAIGVLAPFVVWFGRIARGPLAALALTLGGLAGAALSEWTGNLIAGGTTHGQVDTVLPKLPLTLHMHGLRFAEAAAAVLVYGLCVSFAVADDLGVADPSRDAARASVGTDVELQYAGRDRDGAGGLQQRDLPPQ